jgi:bifunctional non-homologous end joining protein LigD
MLPRSLPAGFIAPCLPSKTDKLPASREWLHEIKHDGFRVIARKNGPRVRLYSRPGNDLTHRFPLIVEALAGLRSRSCIIDGEAVGCDANSIASFNMVRYCRHDESIFLYGFDLIELNGNDLRPDPLEGRKATLEMMLAKAGLGIRFNEHMEGDGETVFRPRLQDGGSKASCQSGRTRPDWLKMKNANAPAVKREEQEEWGNKETLVTGKNRIMIYGPKNDGRYIVEFKTADGEALAISVPAGETRVRKHQERMPLGCAYRTSSEEPLARDEFPKQTLLVPSAPPITFARRTQAAGAGFISADLRWPRSRSACSRLEPHRQAYTLVNSAPISTSWAE